MFVWAVVCIPDVVCIPACKFEGVGFEGAR